LADAGAKFRVTAQQLVEDGHGANAGRGPQHRHDLGVEEIAQRIRTTRGALFCDGRRGSFSRR
jgi:hypothetical protein